VQDRVNVPVILKRLAFVQGVEGLSQEDLGVRANRSPVGRCGVQLLGLLMIAIGLGPKDSDEAGSMGEGATDSGTLAATAGGTSAGGGS
jgi:hypothetical protein